LIVGFRVHKSKEEYTILPPSVPPMLAPAGNALFGEDATEDEPGEKLFSTAGATHPGK
jgi:hypothetical protein